MKGINGALAASYVNALLTHGLTERQFKHLDTDVLAANKRKRNHFA